MRSPRQPYLVQSVVHAADVLRAFHLARRPTPPAKFVKHQVITAANLERFYPNDVLTQPNGATA